MQKMRIHEVRSYMMNQDLGAYLPIARKTYQGGPTYVCPICNNGSGEDGTGFHEDPKRPGRYHCFKCGADGDYVFYVAEKYGIPGKSKEAIRHVCALHGIEFIDEDNQGSEPLPARGEVMPETEETRRKNAAITEYIEKCSQRIEEITPYLKSRGLDENTAKQFKLGYDPCHYFTQDKREYPVLIIPTSDTTYVARNLKPTEKENRWTAKGKRQPWGLDSLETEKEIYITEGELDAISIASLGYPAIGLGGGSRQVLIDKIKQIKAKPHLILSLDNDEGGEEIAKGLEQDLERIDVPFTRANISGGCTDPNEALVSDLEGFKSRLEQGPYLDKIEDYKGNSVLLHVDSLISAIDRGDYEPLAETGWEPLDNILGGVHWGLYILGAISSLGKTTFMLQMMDRMAERNQDVLIFSLEMSSHELIAKSLSRCTAEQLRWDKDRATIKNAKSVRAIMTKEGFKNHYTELDKEILDKAIKRYKGYAQRIYIHEGQGTISIDDIEEYIKTHIAATNNRPAILIDYLQLIAPVNDRWSERKNIDHAVSKLRVLSRDYRVPIFAVSSLNRASYGIQEASLSSFKESGGIEYGADVAFMLQFSAKTEGSKEPTATAAAAHERKEKKKTPRYLELVILKNRNSATGEAIKFLYYPKFNLFLLEDDFLNDKMGEKDPEAPWIPEAWRN